MICDYWINHRRHVKLLADNFGVKINYIRLEYVKKHDCIQAYANPVAKIINIPEINSTITYLAALHEIGHCVEKGGNPHSYKSFRALHPFSYQYFKYTIFCELAAWKFTVKYADVDWTLCEKELNPYKSYINFRRDNQIVPNNKLHHIIMNNDYHALNKLRKKKLGTVPA